MNFFNHFIAVLALTVIYKIILLLFNKCINLLLLVEIRNNISNWIFWFMLWCFIVTLIWSNWKIMGIYIFVVVIWILWILSLFWAFESIDWRLMIIIIIALIFTFIFFLNSFNVRISIFSIYVVFNELFFSVESMIVVLILYIQEISIIIISIFRYIIIILFLLVIYLKEMLI